MLVVISFLKNKIKFLSTVSYTQIRESTFRYNCHEKITYLSKLEPFSRARNRFKIRKHIHILQVQMLGRVGQLHTHTMILVTKLLLVAQTTFLLVHLSLFRIFDQKYCFSKAAEAEQISFHFLVSFQLPASGFSSNDENYRTEVKKKLQNWKIEEAHWKPKIL